MKISIFSIMQKLSKAKIKEHCEAFSHTTRFLLFSIFWIQPSIEVTWSTHDRCLKIFWLLIICFWVICSDCSFYFTNKLTFFWHSVVKSYLNKFKSSFPEKISWNTNSLWPARKFILFFEVNSLKENCRQLLIHN